MLRYLAGRVGQAVLVLMATFTAAFLLLQALPGDAIMIKFMSPEMGLSADQIAEIRKAYGADLPLWRQYFHTLRNFLTGNFGYSIQAGVPVSQQIATNLPPTLLLAALGFAAALVLTAGYAAAVALAVLVSAIVSLTLVPMLASRLLKQVPRPEGAKAMPGVIIPRKTVLEIVKLIEGSDAEVEIALSASKIRFTTGSIVLTSKLIDGTFPDYERVIPRNNDKSLEVDTKLFADAVDRVSTISMEKGRAVKLGIGGGKIVLAVNNPDSGSAEEEVACAYAGPAIDIGFNSRYLLDVAGQIKSEAMIFSLADAGSPTIIRDPGDAQALYVLMPMRV